MVLSFHGSPKATMDPPIWSCVVRPWTLPVGTYSNPSPIEGPTGPIGAFTLNSQ